MLETTDGRAASGRRRQHNRVEGGDQTFAKPPGDYRVVQIDTPSSQRVRDLASRRWDLETAVRFSRAFSEAPPDAEQQERPDEDAFWMAAVIAYGRASNTGIRLTERFSTDLLTPEQSQQHHFLLDLRNKYVAHAVNDWERTVTIAYLTNSSFARKAVTRVGQVHVSVTPAMTHLEELSVLAQLFMRDADKRIRRLHKEMLRELTQSPLDKIYEYPNFRTSNIDESRIGHRRT